MLSALSAEDAEFLVVGAYAMAAHGYPRATGVLAKHHLIENKRATGRPKDLVDAAWLESAADDSAG